MTLLVIDMQPKYRASQHKWMIRNVSAEIRAAVKAEHRIVFLEYTHKPEHPGVAAKDATDRRLMRLVADYGNALVIHKQQDSGVVEVVALLESLLGRRSAVIREEIRVVGVNTGACVAVTVNDMAITMPESSIVVVGKACNHKDPGDDGQESSGNKGLENIDDRPNVAIQRVPTRRKAVAA